MKKHRQYDNEYPSVTEVLGVLRKIGLEMWFKMNTLEYINKASGKGKVIGTATHEAIQSFIETGVAKVSTEWPDEVTFALKSFMKFRKENPEINLKISEEAITSIKYGFNGTLDAPCPPILFDWKTSEKKDKKELPVYDEWKYQCSAYVALWNEFHPEQMITEVKIIVIAKDTVDYRIVPMVQPEIFDCFEEVFLPALKIYNYQRRK